MTSQASILIEQARSNIAEERVVQAIELLQRAERLALENPEVLGQVYFEMARAYALTSQEEAVLKLAGKAVKLNPGLGEQVRIWAGGLARSRKKALGKKVLKEIKPFSKKSTNGGSRALPGGKRVWAMGVVLAGAVLLTGLIYGVMGTRRGANQERFDIERIKSNVGRVFLVAKFYEFGDFGMVTIPLSIGSCFAVSNDGYLITNKHVTKVYYEAKEDKKIASCRLVICFGNQAIDRYDAKIIHESPYIDAALIKVERSFANPLKGLAGEVREGDRVFACGFPGMAQEVVDALDAKALVERLGESIRRVQREGDADFFKGLPEASFEVSITSGIVSSIRTIDGVHWIQTDATIHPGNSGGPLVTPDCKLVAINTLGHKKSESINFSIAVNQLRDEFAPWVALK